MQGTGHQHLAPNYTKYQVYELLVTRRGDPIVTSKMVDEATKKTVASIPTLKTKAGPRDGDPWVQRLKEEYMSLIKVYYVEL